MEVLERFEGKSRLNPSEVGEVQHWAPMNDALGEEKYAAVLAAAGARLQETLQTMVLCFFSFNKT